MEGYVYEMDGSPSSLNKEKSFGARFFFNYALS